MRIVKVILFHLVAWIVAGVLACWICDPVVTKSYSWYHGWWHGGFFPFNYVRSLIMGSMYKAEIYTTAYNVFWWFFSVLSVLLTIVRLALDIRKAILQPKREAKIKEQQEQIQKQMEQWLSDMKTDNK